MLAGLEPGAGDERRLRKRRAGDDVGLAHGVLEPLDRVAR